MLHCTQTCGGSWQARSYRIARTRFVFNSCCFETPQLHRTTEPANSSRHAGISVMENAVKESEDDAVPKLPPELLIAVASTLARAGLKRTLLELALASTESYLCCVPELWRVVTVVPRNAVLFRPAERNVLRDELPSLKDMGRFAKWLKVMDFSFDANEGTVPGRFLCRLSRAVPRLSCVARKELFSVLIFDGRTIEDRSLATIVDLDFSSGVVFDLLPVFLLRPIEVLRICPPSRPREQRIVFDSLSGRALRLRKWELFWHTRLPAFYSFTWEYPRLASRLVLIRTQLHNLEKCAFPSLQTLELDAEEQQEIEFHLFSQVKVPNLVIWGLDTWLAPQLFAALPKSLETLTLKRPTLSLPPSQYESIRTLVLAKKFKLHIDFASDANHDPGELLDGMEPGDPESETEMWKELGSWSEAEERGMRNWWMNPVGAVVAS